jgi:hypothetical protein
MAGTDESNPTQKDVTPEPQNMIDIPTISVTKPPAPPAPLPVNLPTEDDIPIPYHHTPDDDMEAGQGAMQEIDSELEPVSVNLQTAPSSSSFAKNQARVVDDPLGSNRSHPAAHPHVDLLTDEVVLELPSPDGRQSISSDSLGPDGVATPHTNSDLDSDDDGTSDQDSTTSIQLVDGGSTHSTIDGERDRVENLT